MSETPERTRPVPRRVPDPKQYLAGQRVDRYEVGEHLGAGGMGEVYRAWDPLLNRAVALKRVMDEKLGDALGREQLLHEARALSALSHPAIASVYDVVEAHGQLFIVEEFVSGTSLRERLRDPIDLRFGDDQRRQQAHRAAVPPAELEDQAAPQARPLQR